MPRVFSGYSPTDNDIEIRHDEFMQDETSRNPIIDAVVTLVVGAMSAFWLDGSLAVSEHSAA